MDALEKKKRLRNYYYWRYQSTAERLSQLCALGCGMGWDGMLT